MKRNVLQLFAATWAAGITLMLAGRPAESGAPQSAPEHASPADLREQIRAGALHPCVSGHVLDRATDPVIVLQNTCDQPANVMLCVRVRGQAPSYFLLLLDQSAELREHLSWVGTQKFEYRFNSCAHPNCTPPASEC